MLDDLPRDLLLRTLRGETAPRVPCGPLAVHFCAIDAGVDHRSYTLDAVTLADTVVRYCEHYRPDAVWVSADTWVTAEAMGAEVAFPGDGQPLAGTGKPTVRCTADIDALPPPDPATQGRMPLMQEAVRLVADAVGGEVLVVGCFDQSPFSLACALAGINEMMVALMDDRPFVDALVTRCVDHVTAYGEALANAGADMLSTGDSPAGLIGPKLYREVALPAERNVFERLRGTGKTLSLHICGDTTEIVSDMATSGADVLEIDHLLDLDLACSRVPDEVALWGNLDPIGVLARGSDADIERAVAESVRVVRAHDRRRFVLSSGCSLAVETPRPRLERFFAAAREVSEDQRKTHGEPS